jgi:hypothetical protein
VQAPDGRRPLRGYQSLKASAARRHDRKLRHREDAVEKNLRDNDQKFEEQHRRNIDMPCGRCQCGSQSEDAGWKALKQRLAGEHAAGDNLL